MQPIPLSGAVIATYGLVDSDNYLVLGFDFKSGSVFQVQHNRADIRDSTGVAWSMQASQNAPVRVDQDSRFLDEMVLSAIPQAILRRTTANPEMFVAKRPASGNDTEFVFQGMPPRVPGQPTDIKLTLTVEPSGRVSAAQYGENKVNFTYSSPSDAASNPQGIHVASVFAQQPTFALTSVKYSDSLTNPVQLAQRVLQESTAVRLQASRPPSTSGVNVGQPATAQSETARAPQLPAPVRSDSPVSWPLIITGIVLAVLVLLVRMKRRA